MMNLTTPGRCAPAPKGHEGPLSEPWGAQAAWERPGAA
jgi:hypothetical protein